MTGGPGHRWIFVISGLLLTFLQLGGGHTGLILEIPYGTLESGGWFCVEKVRNFFGYIPFKEK